MKYKIGDQVTSKYYREGVVGEVIRTHYSSWSGKCDYEIRLKDEELTHNLYEEDLELVEAPAQDYLDLFI